jgi:hypothetical protein
VAVVLPAGCGVVELWSEKLGCESCEVSCEATVSREEELNDVKD